MKYLVDTNIISYAIRRNASVLNRLKQLSPDDVATSTITLAELSYGICKDADPERRHRMVQSFMQPWQIVAFDSDAAWAYGSLKLSLRHKPIGERDLLIAAIALSRSLCVVTHNLSEFTRVPELNVEDWVE